MSETILLVEDDGAIAEMVDDALGRNGFQSMRAADASEAERALRAQRPDLVVLDWMLPGVSGIEFARKLRRDDSTRDLPIIMLTARAEENDRVKGFDAGIDDYVVKPFSVRELVARIRAVLRRSQLSREDDPIEIDGLHLDPLSHRVTVSGDTVKMGPTEFRMLHFL